MGNILLAGGSEFYGQMAEPDRLGISLTAKADPSLIIIPTAAAPDNNYMRAGNNGITWFKSLGVENVRSLPVIDDKSASDDHFAEIIRHADLVYILGGFPGYLAEILHNSRCGKAIFEGNRRGSVLAGSSAGAMVLCDWFLNPETGKLQAGLGLLSNLVIIPHHEKMGQKWKAVICGQLPDIIIVGIDEQTAMIRKASSSKWIVSGKGSITVYHKNGVKTYSDRDTGFNLPRPFDVRPMGDYT